jgi:hypothetical protein
MKTYLEPEEVERLEKVAQNHRDGLSDRLLSETAHIANWDSRHAKIDFEADGNHSAIEILLGARRSGIERKR